jgi:hypothetical protein
MENVCIFYAHLEYFTVGYNLWPFGIVCGHFGTFPILVCLDQERSDNPRYVEMRPFLFMPEAGC